MFLNWVKKYEEHGGIGLSDKRGRSFFSKSKTKELTELEKAQHELEKEKLKTERLERAIVALKKTRK